MSRTSRFLTMGFVVTVGLAGTGRTASADQTDPFKIVLRVRDTAHVPGSVLTGAQAEVTKIYRQAGVETMWRALASSPANTDASHEPRLTIAILSRDQTERLIPALAHNAMGIAVARAHVAYVSYYRVEQLTGANGVNRAHALGIALAHEIGHLLLPYNSHSETGLMRADWTTAHLLRAQYSQLFFTAQEAELIRAGLSRLHRMGVLSGLANGKNRGEAFFFAHADPQANEQRQRGSVPTGYEEGRQWGPTTFVVGVAA